MMQEMVQQVSVQMFCKGAFTFVGKSNKNGK